MSEIVYPDEQILRAWVKTISDSKLFPADLLPDFNEIWFKEVISFIELLKLSHYKENIHHKAAHLFYKIAKGHRFTDGNKRSAVIALNLFLVVNLYVLKQTPQEIYKLALDVVNSQSNESGNEIEKLEKNVQKIQHTLHLS